MLRVKYLPTLPKHSAARHQNKIPIEPYDRVERGGRGEVMILTTLGLA